MKFQQKLVIFLLLLAFCLPSYSEILIYEYTTTGTYYKNRGGVWEVRIEDDKGYTVKEITYNTDRTINVDQAIYIEYWTDNDGKWFRVVVTGVDFEIERVEYGGNVEWLLIERDVDDSEIHLLTTAGKAHNRDIGLLDKREVATKFNGYDLEVQRNPQAGSGFYCEMEEVTVSLQLRWTKYANDVNGLAQNYAATVQFIKDELGKRGYQEVSSPFALFLESIMSSTL